MIELREICGGIELFEIGADVTEFEVSKIVKYVYLNMILMIQYDILMSFIEIV